MKLKHSIIPLLVVLIWSSCRQNDEPERLQHELLLAEVKLALALSKIENNLITRIESGNQTFTIYFESGDPMTVHQLWIKDIIYDSANWLLVFYFNDNTYEDAYFIGKLSIDEEDVLLNPYLTSPLTALAKIETPVKGKFRVTVKGKSPGGISIEKDFSHYNEYHEIPILGLYENHLNQVEFTFMSNDNKVRCSKTMAIQTPAIQNKPTLDLEIVTNQLSDSYNGLYVVSNLKIGFDQQGAVRWYYNGEGASFFGKVRNGNFIVAEASNLNFFEVTMLGQRVKKYNVPNALHHEIVELPSGNFLVASHSPPGHPFEDVVVEIDRNTGGLVKSWDYNLILDSSRPVLPSTQLGDWLHINAMYYDESDNSIVVSGRSQSAVIKIDYTSGAIRWILSNPNHWSEAFKPYLLKPADVSGNPVNVEGIDFWPYGQHATQKTPGGNLLLYDNGDYRGFYDDPNVPQNSYTRVVEYKINPEKMTVHLAWQFDNSKSVFTRFTGYAQNLGTSRLAAYMWVSNQTPRIIEINNNSQVIYEATINRGKTSYYRAQKTDVYSGL